MNSRRKFLKGMLLSLPPLKACQLLDQLKLPKIHYRVMHLLYVEHVKQQPAADEMHMTLETFKRRHTEALTMLDKSLDAIEM